VRHGGRREVTFSRFTAWRRRHCLRLNEESHAINLKRRELGRNLDAKGWLYPLGETQYGGVLIWIGSSFWRKKPRGCAGAAAGEFCVSPHPLVAAALEGTAREGLLSRFIIIVTGALSWRHAASTASGPRIPTGRSGEESGRYNGSNRPNKPGTSPPLTPSSTVTCICGDTNLQPWLSHDAVGGFQNLAPEDIPPTRSAIGVACLPSPSSCPRGINVAMRSIFLRDRDMTRLPVSQTVSERTASGP
jgi:hypothetical protein